MILRGNAIDLIENLEESPDLIVTDPPYAFGGSGDEHALSALVAVVLRESAKRLKKGSWMLVMCASSWRSTEYMVQSVRGVIDPIRIGHWLKPVAKTKTMTAGWLWASVNIVAFRKGKSSEFGPSKVLDHITMEPIRNGRRAELPLEVAEWMVLPYSVRGGLLLDPFAGSGVILEAGKKAGMRTIGFEKNQFKVTP